MSALKAKIVPPQNNNFSRVKSMGDKTLMPHEMVGYASIFNDVLKIAQNRVDRNVGKRDCKLAIDSIRINLLKTTLKSIVEKNGWTIEKVKSHSKISAHAKKRLASKEVTSLWRIKTKSGFGNIVLETPNTINQSSDYKKYQLTIFGLSQPNKPLNNHTIEELQCLLNRLDIKEIDVSIDSPKSFNLEALKRLGVIDAYLTTGYIHNPIGLTYITKICHYNKQIKDGLPMPLFRLELTCKTKGRISDLFIPIDEIETVLNLLKQEEIKR